MITPYTGTIPSTSDPDGFPEATDSFLPWFVQAAGQVASFASAFGPGAPFCAVGGTANALVLTTGLNLTALVDGQAVRFRPAVANTAAATANIDGRGAVALRTITGAALPPGYLIPGAHTTGIYQASSNTVVVDRIPERGSNANGTFWRFANGLQECTSTLTVAGVPTATGAVYRSDDVSWTFPAVFSSTTGVSFPQPGVRSAGFIWGRSRLMGATGGTAMLFATEAQAGAIVIDVQAIGPWY